MIKRQHIHLLDVVAVLLVSLFANHIIEYEIDFKKSVDWFEVAKVLCLGASAFIFYYTLARVRHLEQRSIRDIEKKSQSKHTNEPNGEVPRPPANVQLDTVDDCYKIHYEKDKLQKGTLIFLSIVLFLMFYLIEPTIKFVCERFPISCAT